jgi:hypothetical protein
MYALALFLGWISGLSVRADLPFAIIIAEIIGLIMWICYEACFAKATLLAWFIGIPLMVVGALSIYALFVLFTLNILTILAIVGALAYGIFGVILNLDALHEFAVSITASKVFK